MERGEKQREREKGERRREATSENDVIYTCSSAGARARVTNQFQIYTRQFALAL